MPAASVVAWPRSAPTVAPTFTPPASTPRAALEISTSFPPSPNTPAAEQYRYDRPGRDDGWPAANKAAVDEAPRRSFPSPEGVNPRTDGQLRAGTPNARSHISSYASAPGNMAPTTAGPP